MNNFFNEVILTFHINRLQSTGVSLLLAILPTTSAREFPHFATLVREDTLVSGRGIPPLEVFL